MAPCKDEYLLFADHIERTGGDLRIVPMYEFMQRCSIDEILGELDSNGFVTRRGRGRVLVGDVTPERVAEWAKRKAESAPPCSVIVPTEENKRYDPKSCVVVVGDTSDVFRPGRWFTRSDFACTLSEACWEPGLIVRLRCRDHVNHTFEVFGDTAPLDIPDDEDPKPQELREVRLTENGWARVTKNSIRITVKPGRRSQLKEVTA